MCEGGGRKDRVAPVRTGLPGPVRVRSACVFITAVPITKLFAREEGGEGLQCVCVLLLQDLVQSCSRGGRRRVEDMCYERRRAEACVDESAHHALVNAGGREIV